jgi:urocanate hydratase
VVEVDPTRIEKRLETRYLDVSTDSIDEALELAMAAKARKHRLSIGLLGNAAVILPSLVTRGFKPDLVTDQTSAHDPLNGYIPKTRTLDEARALRTSDPDRYVREARASMADHVNAMLAFKRGGAIAFDYGNNIRAEAKGAGVLDAFEIKGFVPEYIRPLFCEGKGPFRWAVLSGDPRDLAVTDQAILATFPENESLHRWIALAR